MKKVGVDPSPRQIAEARQKCPEASFHVTSGDRLDLHETFTSLSSITLRDAQVLLEVAEKLATPQHPAYRLHLQYDMAPSFRRGFHAWAAVSSART